MKRLNRLLTNICSNKLEESKSFYTKLFDFEVDYDSDWFIHLISKDKQLELGIIKSGHPIVPKDLMEAPSGFYLTFVVDNADAIYDIAQKIEGLSVISPPEDTFYGQRRLLLKDPNGVIVDVSSPTSRETDA